MQQLGAYTTIRKLGAGGMGEVYLAQHRHLDRRAAVKVLLPEISSNEELVTRFFNEARATSSLRHPSIVEVFDCDVLPNGQAYIVMEFLEGESLAATLRRSPEFRTDVRRLAAIAGMIADALRVAHGQNIIHRDLKPDNVYLAVGSSFPAAVDVKLLDFGIAKLTDDKGSSNTRTGSLLGTPLYMSPEQCRGAGKVDHRTDVYSLGCMLFEMLSGRPPFMYEGAGELLVAHISEPAPPVAALRPDVPPAIGNLVAAMLEKDPAARPQSMQDVLAVIERIVGVPASLLSALVAPPAGFPAQPGPPRVMTPVPRAITGPAALTPPPRAVTGTGPTMTPLPRPITGGGVVVATPVPRAIPGGTAVAPAVKDTTLGASVSVLDSALDDVKIPRGGLRAWHVLVPMAGAAVVAAVFWLRDGPPGSGPQPATTAPPEVAAAAPELPARAVVPVAAPAPEPTEVNVKIGSTPAGAEVWLAGEPQARGKTPVSLKLQRGEGQQAVTLKAPGYAEATLRIDRSRDGATDVELAKLARAPERRAPERRPPPKRLDTRERTKNTGSAVAPTTTKPPPPTSSAPYRAVGD
jgi:serine/threonine-protein kinase